LLVAPCRTAFVTCSTPIPFSQALDHVHNIASVRKFTARAGKFLNLNWGATWRRGVAIHAPL
jgi:hypothetical protein